MTLRIWLNKQTHIFGCNLEMFSIAVEFICVIDSKIYLILILEFIVDCRSFKSWQKTAITEFLGEQHIRIGKPNDFC